MSLGKSLLASLALTSAAMGASSSFAQVQSIQIVVSGEVALESTGSKAIIEGLERAKGEAVKNAWRVIKMRPDIGLKVRNLNADQNMTIANDLRTSCQIMMVDQVVDKKLKQMSARFRFDCNQQDVQVSIDNVIRTSAPAAPVSAKPRLRLATFFIVREVAGTAIYDPNIDRSSSSSARVGVTASDKVSGSYKSDAKERTTESEGYSETAGQINDSSSSRQQTRGSASASVNRTAEISATESQSEQSKGRTVNKAADFKYRSASPEELNASLTDVFKNAGAKIVNYSDIVAACPGPDPDLIAKQYGAKPDDLSTVTRTAIINAARNCGFTYLAIGDALIDGTQPDGVTGSPQYSVILRAKIWDITEQFPETIGSIQKDASASNANPNLARVNAVQQAAQRTGEEMLSRLSAEGVR